MWQAGRQGRVGATHQVSSRKCCLNTDVSMSEDTQQQQPPYRQGQGQEGATSQPEREDVRTYWLNQPYLSLA